MGDFNNYHFGWDLLVPAVAIAIIAFLCYIAGRMQQFRKQIDEREQAFIKGYNTATINLFSLATRVSKTTVSAPPLMEPTVKHKPQPFVRGRHAVNAGSRSTLEKTKQFTVWDKNRNAKA